MFRNIESCSVKSGLPLNLHLYSSDLKDLKKSIGNPIVENMIKVWFDVKQYLKIPNRLSYFTPIWGNSKFIPGRCDAGFKTWAEKGISKIGDLYVNNILMTFEDIVNKYDVPRKHFYKYLQLRSFIHKSQSNALGTPPLSVLEKEITKDCFGKGLISLLYGLVNSGSQESADTKLQAWRMDVNEDIETSDWKEACKETQTQTMSARLKLLQYKWLMRTYVTPVILHKWNSNIPDLCQKCNNAKGTFFHCIWECSYIQQFWKDVKVMAEKILDIKILLTPLTFILHLYPVEVKLKKHEYYFLDMCLLQAKRLISLHWKCVNAPDIRRWLKEMASTMSMEKVCYILKDKYKTFEEIWSPFVQFLKMEEFDV